MYFCKEYDSNAIIRNLNGAIELYFIKDFGNMKYNLCLILQKRIYCITHLGVYSSLSQSPVRGKVLPVCEKFTDLYFEYY